MEYRVLIIGWNAYIGHVADFIRNLKKANPNVRISLLTSKPSINEVPDDVIKNTDEIICFKYYSGKIKKRIVIRLINKIYFLLTFVRLSKKRYDVVDIQYARPRLSYVLHWIKKMSKHIVITPWGSDVFRVENEDSIKKLCKVYNVATRVMVDPETQLAIEAKKKFKFSPSKILPISWGIEYVDYIKEASPKKTVEESKARFGLENRYVITCGYNPQMSQRHEAIIDAVAKVKNNLPDNMTLLFPFTYGDLPKKDYDQWILEKCAQCGLKGIIINEFLSYEDMYMLRNATDMFVHVQTTDASSACVMQYILCNKKIVHGSWMKYNDLERYKPLFYFPVDNMEELGDVILSAYQSNNIEIPQGVFDTIMAKGWSTSMKRLNEYFESLL